MKKYKVGICGNFDSSVKNVNGQSQKTINVKNKLAEKYGEANILCLDTYLFRRNPIKAVLKYIGFLKKCENVVLLPAQNSIKLLVPVAAYMKNKYGFKLFYSVIGGWLAEAIKENVKLKQHLRKFECIYPETESLKIALEKQGLRNLKVMANFKNIASISEDEIKTEFKEPYRICFFSRVTPQKGVDDLIKAIKEINAESPKFILDIYGPVFAGYQEEFFKSIDPPYINYKGIVEYDKGIDVLKEYFIHVFPTKYLGDGIPGSIVDSYFAGLPVIASKWPSCLDIIDEDKTGLVYEFCDYNGLKEKLLYAYNNPDKLITLRRNCLEKSREYHGDTVMQDLYERIEGRL